MARNIGVNFNGQRIVHPSAHAKIDASALNSVGSSTDKIVAILGQAEGGKPNEVYTITSSLEASEIFKGGDLVKACELAFNPSGDGYGAGTIIAIRSVAEDTCKQATATVGGMEIKALDYGENGNNIQVELVEDEDGIMTLKVMDIMTGVTEVYDNLGQILKVTGVEGHGNATIGVANGVITVNDGEKDVLKLEIKEGSVYEDINKVIQLINKTGVIKVALASSTHKTLNSSTLDDKNYGVGDVITALKGDIMQQVAISSLVEINVTGTVTAFTGTMLQGGANGDLNIDANILGKLNGEGAYIIVPLTDDPTMQNAVHTYVNEQSQDERSLAIGVYGGGLNETIDEVIDRALSFSSSRAVVCYPPILKSTTDDNPEKLASYFTACLVAGRVAGKETGDPITLDTVSINGLVKTPTKTEVNRLLEAGVTTIEFVRNSGTKGYRIAQGLTTYQQNTNPNYREIGMRTVSDEIIGELVERLETNFVGGKGTRTTVALIKNDVQSFLDQKVREDIIVEYDAESVTVQLQGDTVHVTFSCVPVGAINYILVTTTYTQASLLA